MMSLILCTIIDLLKSVTKDGITLCKYTDIMSSKYSKSYTFTCYA